MSIKKTSLQEALLEAKEIEKAMHQQARQEMEKEFSPKIDAIVKSALQEIESDQINEEIKIEFDGDSKYDIKVDENGKNILSIDDSIVGNTDDSNTNTETQTNSETENIDTMDNLDEEIFEVENTQQEMPMQQTPATQNQEVPPPPTTDDVSTGEQPSEEMGEEGDFKQEINKKLDAILAAVGGEESSEGEGQTNQEGNVEIIDDENNDSQPQQQPQPQPQMNTNPTPMQEDDDSLMFEFDEDMFNDEGNDDEDTIFEFDDMDEDLMDEKWNVVDEGDDDIDLDFGDEDDELEETRGVSFAANKRAGERNHFNDNNSHHSPVAHMNESENVNKIKALYESKLDELKKENKSLNETLKEYTDSFVNLRKQIDHVQVINAKFAFANKLLTKSGWTKEEKNAIMEQFNLVETREDAKKLFNKMISESKNFKKAPSNSLDKLKDAQPDINDRKNVTSTKPLNESTQFQTLHESEESLRWKELAGIIRLQDRG